MKLKKKIKKDYLTFLKQLLKYCKENNVDFPNKDFPIELEIMNEDDIKNFKEEDLIFTPTLSVHYTKPIKSSDIDSSVSFTQGLIANTDNYSKSYQGDIKFMMKALTDVLNSRNK